MIMNQLRENEQWIFRDIYPADVFDWAYRADLELLKDVGQRMTHHFVADRELYELVVYERSSEYPQGWLELTARARYPSSARTIYNGALTRESWDRLIQTLYDNFIDTYQFG